MSDYQISLLLFLEMMGYFDIILELRFILKFIAAPVAAGSLIAQSKSLGFKLIPNLSRHVFAGFLYVDYTKLCEFNIVM